VYVNNCKHTELLIDSLSCPKFQPALLMYFLFLSSAVSACWSSSHTSTQTQHRVLWKSQRGEDIQMADMVFEISCHDSDGIQVVALLLIFCPKILWIVCDKFLSFHSILTSSAASNDHPVQITLSSCQMGWRQADRRMDHIIFNQSTLNVSLMMITARQHVLTTPTRHRPLMRSSRL